MSNVFTYGSLMFGPVWSRVVRREYDSHDASVSGFKRRQVKGTTYPAIYPNENGDTLAGRVYLNVSGEDMNRLDIFEGEYYQRQSTRCSGEFGEIEAEIYVFKTDYIDLISELEWNPEWFLREGMQIFINGYIGFDRTAI